jgi:hypothetical protein
MVRHCANPRPNTMRAPFTSSHSHSFVILTLGVAPRKLCNIEFESKGGSPPWAASRFEPSQG